MKKLFLLLLLPFSINAQQLETWAQLDQMRLSCQLIPNSVYVIIDYGNTEICAKTCSTFYERPLKRTIYAIDYDDELFDFASKTITAFDNIDCVVRCNGGWFIINDAGHTPYRVSSVSGNLIVHFQKTYDKVVGFSTSIDDAYSASNYNISCGASVGFGTATIFVHKCINGVKTQMTIAELSIPTTNIFIIGRFSKQIPIFIAK